MAEVKAELVGNLWKIVTEVGQQVEEDDTLMILEFDEDGDPDHLADHRDRQGDPRRRGGRRPGGPDGRRGGVAAPRGAVAPGSVAGERTLLRPAPPPLVALGQAARRPPCADGGCVDLLVVGLQAVGLRGRAQRRWIARARGGAGADEEVDVAGVRPDRMDVVHRGQAG